MSSSAVKTRRTTPSRGVSRNITGTMQKGKEDEQKLYTIAETSGQRSKETTTGKKDATKLALKIKKAAKNEEKEEKREAEKETSTGTLTLRSPTIEEKGTLHRDSLTFLVRETLGNSAENSPMIP
ncbi:hypothetical protein ACLKA6_018709 [Drosophila palustris]